MRVLVKKPAIFILDEATASIDPFTEWQSSRAQSHPGEFDSILIAHRLSTVRAADRIVVMREGAIIRGQAVMTAAGAGRALRRVVIIRTSGIEPGVCGADRQIGREIAAFRSSLTGQFEEVWRFSSQRLRIC